MPKNIADAQNSYLEGRARFEEWRENFLLTWQMPVIEMQMAMTIQRLKALPPEMQEALRQSDPQAWADMIGE